MTSDPPPVESDAQAEALRVQATAIAAQQIALIEQEVRVCEQRQALEVHERELAARLDERRQQLLALQDQLAAGRDLLRRERADRDAAHNDATAARAAAIAERERLRALRDRFVRRWKKHWAQERDRLHNDQDNLQRDAERLLRERESLEMFRRQFHGGAELEKRRLEHERRLLDEEKARLAADRCEFNTDLAKWEKQLNDRTEALRRGEQKLALDRQATERQCDILRGEARGLENRVAHLRKALLDQERQRAVAPAVAVMAIPTVDLPAPLPMDVEAEFAARDKHQHEFQVLLERQAAALADQRAHLAELCERMAVAQSGWHNVRVNSADELAELVGDLIQRDDSSRGRARELQADADRLRLEREAIGRLRRELERTSADLAARQSAWAGERTRLLAEIHGRERVVERRGRALKALFHRWRDHRAAEVAEHRQTIQAMSVERAAWATQRDEWRHRSQSVREAMQAIAEQALALEEARQEFTSQSDRPAAAKRLERLRRRWEGLSRAARRELTRHRSAVDTTAAALEIWLRGARERAARQAERERKLAGDQSEFEAQRLHFEAEIQRLEMEREIWREQRRRYEAQLAELRDEVDRVARLLIDDGPDLLSTAA